MKRIIIALFIASLCTSLSAQQRIDGFKLISDVCKTKISLEVFKDLYKHNIIKEEEGENSQLVNVKGLTLAGYESSGIVIISPELNWRIVAVMPDHESLDSVSRYQAAEKCHAYTLTKLGNPNQEDNAIFDNPMFQEITGTLNVKGGKMYVWTDKNDIPYISMRLNTDKEDYYIIMALMTPSPYATNTPIQRTFFKVLEFGKYATRQQVATALAANYFDIQEERKSSGKSYSYWEPIYFGGIEWSFIEIGTVEGKLATVRLTDSQLKDNMYIYDRLLEALTDKYGEPKVYDSSVFWNDGTTAVELSHSYSESKGGEMRYYVNIEYTDIELFRETQRIITNEL